MLSANLGAGLRIGIGMRGKNRFGRNWPGAAGWLLTGIGIGWLTAPRRGSFFRSRIRQKAGHWGRIAMRYADQRRRDWRNRLAGRAAELQRAVRPPEPVAAGTLAARVRSQLGREFSLGQVEITAEDGVVHLAGQVASPSARHRLIAAVRAQPGVHGVEATHLKAAA